MKPDDFITMLAPAARASANITRIPASFTLAQAALESGWGSSKTSANARNLFNIKADKSWTGPWWEMSSTEHIDGKDVLQPARWRMYPDWQACLDDRAKFFKVNPRYAACFKEMTGEGWARAVAAAGYATDPDYADKLIATMRSHNMTQHDAGQETTTAPAPAALTPEVPAQTPGILSAVFSLLSTIFSKKGSK